MRPGDSWSRAGQSGKSPPLQAVPPQRTNPPPHSQALQAVPRPGRQAHGEGHQVAVGNSEEQHEGDEVGVLREDGGQPGPLGHVAQHEERNEQGAQADQQGQQPAVLVRLRQELGSARALGAGSLPQGTPLTFPELPCMSQ